MTKAEEKEAESLGRKVGAFLAGLFSDKRNLLIAVLALGMGADKLNSFISPKETYWDEKDIQNIISQSIEREFAKKGGKIDRLAASIDALIKAQDPRVRLRILDDLQAYDRRTSNKGEP